MKRWHVFSDFLQIYYHGETIKVHVSVKNDSNKNIKNIICSGKHHTSCQRRKTEEYLNVCCMSNEMFLRVSSVDQVSTVVLYSNDAYVKAVAIEEQGCVIFFWLTESQNLLLNVAWFTGCRQFASVYHWPMFPHSPLFWDLRLTVLKILVARRSDWCQASNFIRN